MTTTTGTPLVNRHCREMKQHLIAWAGIGLCCVHDYSRDEKRAPRSYTLPREQVAGLQPREPARAENTLPSEQVAAHG